MTDLHTAAKLALEALKKSDDFLYNWHESSSDDEADAYSTARQLNELAFTALREALAQERSSDEQPAQQEPLTPDQVFAIADQHPVEGFDPEIMAFARAIEAAHGIKGGGA